MAPRSQTTRFLLHALLRPVIRFCLRNSIDIRQLTDAARSVFIDLASGEVRRRGRKVTVSHLSAMTGVNRRDVTAIYRERRLPQQSESLVYRLIGQWEQDKRFLTNAGKPRVLSFGTAESEFTALAKMVSKDLNPASMLFELERAGAVERVRNGVRLISTVEYFDERPDEGWELMSLDSETLVEALEENLFSPQDTKNLHLRTEYDNIFADDVAELRKWVLKQGTLFHKRARDHLSQHDKDINPDSKKAGGAKIVLTSFSWTSSLKTE